MHELVPGCYIGTNDWYIHITAFDDSGSLIFKIIHSILFYFTLLEGIRLLKPAEMCTSK